MQNLPNESQSAAVSRLYDESKSYISQEDLIRRRLMLNMLFRESPANHHFSGGSILEFQSMGLQDEMLDMYRSDSDGLFMTPGVGH